MAAVLSELDHTNINDHPAFHDKNPSSECLAAYIHGRVKEELRGFESVMVSRVTVCETPQTGVTYSEEG
jgi:6-pyruvoyltetrahydropterin/6-carboxytetrahydropterin synthase